MPVETATPRSPVSWVVHAAVLFLPAGVLAIIADAGKNAERMTEVMNRSTKQASEEAGGIQASLSAGFAILVESGEIEAAADLSRHARDWDQCVQLVARYSRELLDQGRSATVLEWLAAIPAAVWSIKASGTSTAFSSAIPPTSVISATSPLLTRRTRIG